MLLGVFVCVFVFVLYVYECLQQDVSLSFSNYLRM